MSLLRKTVSRRHFVALTAVGLIAACAPQPPTTPKPADSQKPAEAAKPAESKPAEAAKPAAPAPAAPAAAGQQPAVPATSAPVPKVAEKPAEAAKPGGYKEAPMLAELVKAGKLPPVEQRLPEQPQVVKPTTMIGKYGGTLRGAGLGPEVNSDLQMIMNTGLFSFNHDLSEVTPVVALSYEMSPDDKSVTFKLRKGIKWSDGVPFTTDDMVFYAEDVIYNKELYPAPPGEWRVGGQPVKVTKIDDYTIKYESTVPMPAFPLLQYSGPPSTPWRPKHFLSKMHPK
jgi:ABC-type transport system substrate-binding protein